MRSREFARRMLPAAATDLRSLVEKYAYPIVVCDEEGAVRFCNVPAQALLGQDLVERSLPAEWMDQERLAVDLPEHGLTTLRLYWSEVTWEGNPAWYLLTFPAEGGDSEELKSRLEHSMELVATEAERRQQVESEREKLEAKLRDLHQRSVTKLEAARQALESERAEREALSERLSRLKEETDELRAQLDEKRSQLEEARHHSSEMFESLQSELEAKQRALALAEERSERYRKVYEELDLEMTRSQEQAALLSAKLHTAESRLERAQRLLDSGSLEAVVASESGEHQRELQHLRERLVELESELRRARLEAEEASLTPPPTVDPSAALLLERERELNEARSLLAELRLHQAQELREAREALRRLSWFSPPAGAGEPSAETVDPTIGEELRRAQARIAELEQALPSGGDSTVWEERVADLEARLLRAQNEASPEDLLLARRRISELEHRVSASEQAAAAGDSERQRLETELARSQTQVQEMARELQRTLDGDHETKKLAYADQLTGLPNYNLTGQYLQVCFDRSGRQEGALALILIDLDNFRRVNDALGSKSGDELLRQVGARLQRTVTENDTAIARRGEDEFLVVAFLEGAAVDSEALSARVRGIAHNLLSELIKPFDVYEQRVQITASMGVALYPGPALDREALLEQAEHAMYKAKEAGRARVSFYTQEIHQLRERKAKIERELRQAVIDCQFTLLYQPIVEIPSGKVMGVEALLRWSHPQRGLLEPSEFLAIAEESGAILTLSEQVLQEAMAVAKQKFMKRRFMSLNLSHRQLVDSSFPSRFMKQLERAQVKPQEVMVEVSERTLRMDPERSRQTLASLSQWGVGIALDDFGSGASELSLFREFPIKLVKIDGGLIRKVAHDREAARLCLALTRMASALEIPALAEGIESREQLEVIASLGFQYAQGIALREPMNVNQLSQIL